MIGPIAQTDPAKVMGAAAAGHMLRIYRDQQIEILTSKSNGRV
jgi:hypothetical protein